MWSLRDLVVADIAQRLSFEGWRLIEDGDDFVFTLPRMGAISYEVGLGASEGESGLVLRPDIGILHGEVESLASRFYGLPASRTCIVGRSLIDLTPYRSQAAGSTHPYLVSGASAVDVVSRLFISDLNLYGVPFLDSLAKLEDVAAYLDNATLAHDDRAHLIIILAMLDNKLKAKAHLEAFRREAEAMPPLISSQSQRFAAAVDEFFEL